MSRHRIGVGAKERKRRRWNAERAAGAPSNHHVTPPAERFSDAVTFATCQTCHLTVASKGGVQYDPAEYGLGPPHEHQPETYKTPFHIFNTRTVPDDR